MRRSLAGFFVAAMLVFVLASAGAVMADNIAYEATGSDNFGTVNLNTGVYTQIGNMGQLLSGLGVANGAIYGGVEGGSTLYRVNTANGALTAIGSGNMNYWDTGSTLSGLYALGTDGYLYSINPSTGATTSIGSIGFSKGAVGTIGLSTNSGTLYLTVNANLYTLNTATGAATLVGNTSTSGIGALVTESGTLYGGVSSPLSIYILNPGTGAGMFVANQSAAYGNFWGLTPLPTPVPIPGALVLFGPGLAGLAAMKRRFRK
jgi:hypothetical protein